MTKSRLYRRCFFLGTAALLLVAMLALPAQAAGLLSYVGPGAGLSMLGALLAVAGIVALGLLGLILYPIRLIRRWCRQRRQSVSCESCEDLPATAGPLDE